MNKYKELGLILNDISKDKREVFSAFFNRCDFEFKGDGFAYIRLTNNNVFTIGLSDKYFKLKHEHRIGVLAHELIHMMYKHPLTYAGRHTDEILQISMDLFINQIVHTIFGSDYLPPEGVHIQDFIEIGVLTDGDRNKDTEYYYKKLINSPKIKKKYILNHDWGCFKNISDIENKVLNVSIDSTLKKVGNIPGSLRGLKPESNFSPINYKRIIDTFLMNSFLTEQAYSYSHLNKRFADAPGSFEIDIPHLLLILDTSGSIIVQDLNQMFDQVDKIFKIGCLVDILEIDCKIGKKVYKYDGKRPEELSGGGGTDFDPGLDYVNKFGQKYGAVLYLTDGIASTPRVRISKPLLWVLISSTKREPSDLKSSGFSGSIIKINHEK